MTVVAYILLVWFGLAFGSFINALVWRLRQQDIGHRKEGRGKKTLNPPSSILRPNNYSIVSGRSMCPHCSHLLAWYDLLPVVSWLWLRGRCRYCKKPISIQYPLVELALALVFTLSYAFWPVNIQGGQWALFISWLICCIGLLALLVYDARWMELPSKIIYPTLAVAIVGRIIYIAGFAPDVGRAVAGWFFGVLVASGVFWLLYMLSKGRWIGYGDVRLGWITGTLLASPAKSFLMIFMASVIGILFITPALAASRKTLTSKLPYGPFLITATAVTILVGQIIIDWYKDIFLP